MPRRRFRDPDPQVRDRNMLDILGAPGLSGLSRVGGFGGGGQSSIVVRGGREGGDGVQIEHVTLEAVASQTIADGGGTVQWDTVRPAPKQVRGFDTLLDNLASSGSVGDVPVDVTGVLKFRLDGEWASWRSTGTLTATLLRDGSAVGDAQTYDIAGAREFGGDDDDGWEVRSGDSMRYELSNDSGAGKELEWGTLHQLVRAVASPTSTVSGEARLTDLEWAEVTSSSTLDINVPTSTSIGDLLMAGVASHGSGISGDATTPASAPGWTQVIAPGPISGKNGRFTVLSKIATQADIDAGSATFTVGSGSTGTAGFIATIVGADTVGDSSGFANQSNSTDLTVSAGGASLLLGVNLCHTGSQINTNTPFIPTEFTVAVDGDGQGTHSFGQPSKWELGTLVSPSSGGPFTFTFTGGLTGEDRMYGALVALS